MSVGSHEPDEDNRIIYESTSSAFLMAVSPKLLHGPEGSSNLIDTALGLGCSVYTSLRYRAELLNHLTQYIGLAPRYDSVGVEFALTEGQVPPLVYLLVRASERSGLRFTKLFGYEDIELFAKNEAALACNEKYTVVTDHPRLLAEPPIPEQLLKELCCNDELTNAGIYLRYIYISDQNRTPLSLEGASGVVRFVFEIPPIARFTDKTAEMLKFIYIRVIALAFPMITTFELTAEERKEGESARNIELKKRFEEHKQNRKASWCPKKEEWEAAKLTKSADTGSRFVPAAPGPSLEKLAKEKEEEEKKYLLKKQKEQNARKIKEEEKKKKSVVSLKKAKAQAESEEKNSRKDMEMENLEHMD